MLCSPSFSACLGSSFRKLRSLFIAAGAAWMLTAAGLAQSTLTYDFETAGQWTGNFRSISGAPTGTVGQTTVSSNGLLRFDITGGNQSFAYLFDQTPGDTTAATQSTFAVTGPISVRYRARTNASNSSFSVIFADPANLANNVTGIVNILTGADQVRFFKDGTPNAAGAGVGTQVGTAAAPTVVEPDGSTFTTVTVTLTISGTTPTLTINWGGTNYVSTFAAGDFDFANGKAVIILRLFDPNTAASAVDVDDLTITSPAPPDNGPGPNAPPALPSQSDRTIGAQNPLVVNNAATDDPSQTLTYQLTNPPAGASISTAGVISWTPTTAQISDTPYTITTVVTDNGSPALSATNSFQVTVLPSNGWTQTLDFNTAGQFSGNFRTLAALGGGTAAQTTVSGEGMFRLDTNTSTGNTFAAYVFDQTPADSTLGTQSCFDTSSPVTVSADVRAVTSDSSVAIYFADPDNASNNITAIFNIRTGSDTIRFFKDGVKSATGLGIGTQVGSTATLTTNAEPGTNAAFTNFSVTLTRSGSQPTLSVSVAGASPASYTFYKGNIDWARTAVFLRVFDASPTASSTPLDIDNFTVTASGAPSSPIGPNTAPTLSTIADRTISAGRLLMVANPAVDFDSPAQTLTYALTQAPAGAAIASDGTITWRPAAADVSATPYVFTTQVTDNGSPALSATNTFSVTVSAAQNLGAFTSELDFSTPDQFAGTFRRVTEVGGGTDQQVGNRLVFDATSNGGNQSGVFLFDSSPNDDSHATQSSFPTSSPVTVSFSVRAAVSDSSVGVIFAQPNDASNNLTALFNIKDDADRIRFFKDGSLTGRSASFGAQVGSSVDLITAAEPGYLEYVPVTVTLSVSGTTPTISVKVGDAAPVVSSYAAGDIDWTNTLVYLRLTDSSVSTNTPIEINNLLIAGATPVAPPTPTLPPAPGADGNLITVNPSFESGSLNNFSGAYTIPGWNGTNAAFANHAITTGSVAAGTTTNGTKKLLQSWGGTLTTAVTARPTVKPGLTYELTYDQRALVRNFPTEKLGSIPFIEFFSAEGVRLKQAWGLNSNYKVQYVGKDAWQTFTLRAVAPPGAAYAGLFFNNPVGRFQDSTHDYTQDRHVEMDNIRLKVVPEKIDRLAYRRGPRLVEPGLTETLTIHTIAMAARELRVALYDAAGIQRAAGAVTVPAGRFRAIPVNVAMPAVLANGTYSWQVELLPTGGGAAVAKLTIPGVLVDETVSLSTAANGRDFDSDDPNLQFMGRIDTANPKQPWLHWFGSEIRARFTGTSFALRGALAPNGFGGSTPANIQAVVDEDFANPISITLTNATFVQTLASGLAGGVHTIRIIKSAESDQRIRIDGVRVDAGSGLMRPEPLPTRRLEFYGDSVTSGGSASTAFYAYAPLLGRELDCDARMISKGGTGVAASFSGQDILVNYYNNLDFSNVFNAASGTKYDMSRWTPDAVVCAIGHNDQFNGGSTNFNSRYAEFKGYIRTAYPNAPFITANTLISANLGMFQDAVDPLVAADSKHTFAFQPNSWTDSNSAHPPTDAHIAQVYGDERRYSLADVVEDRAGWGLDAPLSGYEQWCVNNFSTSAIAAGRHAPTVSAAGDGISNVLRYALDLPPFASVPRNQIQSQGIDAQGRLTLTFNRARSDARYVVELSDDLLGWQTAADNPGSPQSLVTFVDPSAPSVTGRRFARLRISLP